MSNVTLWARPAWNTDRWVRDFFGSAAADDWFKGFRPAAEIAKDGDDAVVRVELPGVDVERDVNVEVDKGQLVIHGERRDERIQEDPAKEVRYAVQRCATARSAGRSGCRRTSTGTRSPRRTTPVC